LGSIVRELVYQIVYPHTDYLFTVYYLLILILSIAVYQLGFAKKLPLLKAAIVYLILAVGCLVLAFLGIALPVAESLIIALVILIVVRLRTRNNSEDNFRKPISEHANKEKDKE